jgi:hypothetical protein
MCGLMSGFMSGLMGSVSGACPSLLSAPSGGDTLA